MLAKTQETSDRSAGTLLLVALVCWLLSGCTSVKQSFKDVPADQVWTAMVAVAENPRYDDWHLAENQVWVDAPEHRIEVYRRLQRVLYRPAAKPYPQEQAWRFRIDFETDEAAAPEAVFVSRGFNIPAYAWAEGDRYFADVRDILGGLEPTNVPPSSAAPRQPAPEPEPPPPPPPMAPEDLLDVLEPAPEPGTEPAPTEPPPAPPEPPPAPTEAPPAPTGPPAAPESVLPASPDWRK